MFVLDSVVWCGSAIFLTARPVTEIVVFVLDSVVWCRSAILLAARPVIVFVVFVLGSVVDEMYGMKRSITPKSGISGLSVEIHFTQKDYLWPCVRMTRMFVDVVTYHFLGNTSTYEDV